MRFYDRASRKTGVTGEELMRQLETRLDAVVLRMGFALTQRQARQLVSHGHVKVDGRRVDVPAPRSGPSRRSRSPTRRSPSSTCGGLELAPDAPPYMYVNKDQLEGTLSRYPERGEIPLPGPDRGAAHHRVLLVSPVGTAPLRVEVPSATAPVRPADRGSSPRARRRAPPPPRGTVPSSAPRSRPSPPARSGSRSLASARRGPRASRPPASTRCRPSRARGGCARARPSGGRSRGARRASRSWSRSSRSRVGAPGTASCPRRPRAG